MAAEVLIKFLGDSAQLGRVVNGIRQDTQQMDTGWQRAGKTLGNLKLPAIAAAGALFTMAHRAGQTADALLDMQEQTGVSTDKLQEMRYVADQAGVSQDFYAEAVNEVVKAHDRIARGTGPAAEALDTLGISAQNADGSLRGAQEITDDVMNALLGVEDASMRAALAEDIFKRKAQDMLPVLGMGADGIEDMRDRAHELGIVQSGEALDAANEYRQSMEEMQAKVMALTQELMESLMPALTDHVIPALEWAIDIVGDSVEGWSRLGEAINQFAFGAVEDLGEVGEVAPKEFERMSEAAVRFRGRLGELHREQGDYRASIFEIKDAFDAQAAAANTATTAIRTQAEEMRKATDPAFALYKANEEYNAAQQKVSALEASGKTNTQEYRDAVGDLLSEQVDLNAATEEYEAVAGDAGTMLYELGEQARIAKEHVDDFRYSLEHLNRVSIDPKYIGVDMDDIWRQLRIYEGGGNTPI